MMSFRKRIMMLLVVSIIGVVALATGTVFSIQERHELEADKDPLVKDIRILTRIASGISPQLSDFSARLSEQFAPGIKDEAHTQFLNDILRRANVRSTVVATRDPDTSKASVSIRLSDNRWVITDIPDPFRFRSGRRAVMGWVALIILGAIAVAFYFTSVLVRPLKLLESSVSKIGPDGTLAPLPEKGPEEVRTTAHAINLLSEKLKTAMESRMRLIAAAGHDLRTPITRMRLRAEFLEEDEREKWFKDLNELEWIADSAIRLVREEITQDETRPLNLDGLVDDIADELAILGYPVSIGRLDKASVLAGPLGLSRALRNLIINAATHGNGAAVALTAENDEAVLTITDHGPGIPEKLLDKVFEPFFRVDPARRQIVPGAGLGLAIAKEIIERYDGSVTLENIPGGGLKQTIRLKKLTDRQETGFPKSKTIPEGHPA